MRTLTSSLLVFSLVACGGRSESAMRGDGDSAQPSGGSENGDGDGDAVGDGDGAGSGGAGASTGVGGTPSTGGTMSMGGTSTGGSDAGPFGGVEEFCSDACEDVETFDQGCAEFYPCADVEEPTEWDGACWARASRWSDTAREAFIWCLENDPLCFVSAEGCMLDRLFGMDPSTQTYIGMDLSFPDGTAIGVATEGETQLGEIEGGAFTLSVEGLRWSDVAETAPVWLDANGNGACDPQDDLFALPHPTFNGNFEEPVFIAELTDEDFRPVAPNFCERF